MAEGQWTVHNSLQRCTESGVKLVISPRWAYKLRPDAGLLPLTDRRLRLKIREPGVAWRRVVDDMVLLDVERSVYHGLNQTGALVWKGLAEQSTVGELVDPVDRAYPDHAGVAARDVPAFLGALLHSGLVEIQADDATRSEDAT